MKGKVMGNVADEATLIRQWLSNELAQLLGGVGGDRATEATLNAILQELRHANRRWFGVDAVGGTYNRPLSPFFQGIADVITGNAPPVSGYALWLDSKRDGTLYQDAGRTTEAGAGDLVGGWYDPTTAITATAAGNARPIRAANGLTFDGSNDRLQLPSLDVHQWPGMTVLTVIATAPAIPAFQIAVSMQQAGVIRWGLGPSGDASQRHGWAGAGANVALNQPAADNLASSVYVHAYRRSPTSWRVRRGATEGAPIADATYPTAAPTIWLGAESESGGSYWLTGELRAVLIYPYQIGDFGLASTVEWLAARHGATL